MLDKHNPVPLYYQLKTILEDQIDSEEYPPGTKIPSENQLCKQYSISRTTVRQAINELVNNGKLVRTQGRGTFVAELKIIKPTYKLSGFTQDMKDLGRKPRSRVLELVPLIPSAHIRKVLNLDTQEVAVFIKRLRYNGDDVMGLDSSFFPFYRFSNLLNEDLAEKSLYKLLSTKYNTIPSRSTYNVEAKKCPREIANLLEITPADPVLFLQEVVFDQNDRVFEYGEEYFRADRFSFRIQIRRQENESFRGFVAKG